MIPVANNAMARIGSRNAPLAAGTNIINTMAKPILTAALSANALPKSDLLCCLFHQNIFDPPGLPSES